MAHLFVSVCFKVYGCQMNVNDTEIIWSILKNNGYKKTDNLEEADVVLIVTCAIRESAELKIDGLLSNIRTLIKQKQFLSGGGKRMKVGVLGKKTLNYLNSLIL